MNECVVSHYGWELYNDNYNSKAPSRVGTIELKSRIYRISYVFL